MWGRGGGAWSERDTPDVADREWEREDLVLLHELGHGGHLVGYAGAPTRTAATTKTP